MVQLTPLSLLAELRRKHPLLVAISAVPAFEWIDRLPAMQFELHLSSRIRSVVAAVRGDLSRYIMASAVVLLHLVFAHLLSENYVKGIARQERARPIEMVFLEADKPAIAPSPNASISAMGVLLKEYESVVPHVDIPLESDESDPVENSATSNTPIVAPRILEADLPDVAPYARMAGLSTGQASIVVLRIEVLPDGAVGRVRIDVSSGIKQVDEAAIRFAKLTRWIPGSVGGVNKRVWTRYGVQLIA